MDKLTSPKFKSKVEQFYYENGANSELDLTGGVDEVFSGEQESPRGRNVEKLRLEEARRRAYSGERRGVFSFEPEDLKNIDTHKHGSLGFFTFFWLKVVVERWVDEANLELSLAFSCGLHPDILSFTRCKIAISSAELCVCTLALIDVS